MIGKTMIAPIDRIKLIFLTSSNKFTYKKGFLEFRDIIKKEGVLSLWRGNSAIALRVFPYAALQFTAYDSLRYVSCLLIFLML